MTVSQMRDREWKCVSGIWADHAPALGFLAELPAGTTEILLAAASVYRLRINGEVISYGPARAPLGFARTERIPVSAAPRALVSIEVTAYQTENFYYPKQQPFLKAAFLDGAGNFSGMTGDGKTFRIFALPFRNWQAPKLTHQRDLMEQYDFTRNPAAADWFLQKNPPLRELAEESIPLPRLIERSAPPPVLSEIHEARLLHSASLDTREADFAETVPAKILEACRIGGSGETYRVYDFGKLRSGFLILDLEAQEESELLIGWDELLLHGTYDFRRAYWANNFIRLRVLGGKTISFESFEPYAMRCVCAAVLSGNVRVKCVRLREYAFDAARFLPRESRRLFSPQENTVYEAACETFRQNAVDVFMDCPGRERAAWLCDSFFMARAEFFLTGRSDVEDDFLENYFLPDSYPLPEEWMIPMCFPADNPRKSFLPQWPFWLFLEIFEKRKRGRGRDFTGLLEPRFRKYIAGCGRCRNREGFLENLPGWNFIEWSRAEEFFQGVHFPTNMLYRKCLKEAGLCYGDRAFLDQAEELQEKIIERSFDGEWFRDNAPDGGPLPEKGGNISEICQYYADFCLELSDADPRFAGWRKRLLDGGKNGRMVPAAMFIGLILRFESLRTAGRFRQLLAESVEKLLPMARETGTLWEKETPMASCCHGFASVLAPLLGEAAEKTRSARRTAERPHALQQETGRSKGRELSVPVR